MNKVVNFYWFLCQHEVKSGNCRNCEGTLTDRRGGDGFYSLLSLIGSRAWTPCNFNYIKDFYTLNMGIVQQFVRINKSEQRSDLGATFGFGCKSEQRSDLGGWVVSR